MRTRGGALPPAVLAIVAFIGCGCLFDVDSHDLIDAKVVGTTMDGEFTHRDGI